MMEKPPPVLWNRKLIYGKSHVGFPNSDVYLPKCHAHKLRHTFQPQNSRHLIWFHIFFNFNFFVYRFAHCMASYISNRHFQMAKANDMEWKPQAGINHDQGIRVHFEFSRGKPFSRLLCNRLSKVVPTRYGQAGGETWYSYRVHQSFGLLPFYWVAKMWQSMTSTYDIVKTNTKKNRTTTFLSLCRGYLCRTTNQKLLDMFFLSL